MTIFKKGECQSSATTSSTVLVCNKCGYTTIAKGVTECPECHSALSSVTSKPEETPAEDTPDTV